MSVVLLRDLVMVVSSGRGAGSLIDVFAWIWEKCPAGLEDVIRECGPEVGRLFAGDREAGEMEGVDKAEKVEVAWRAVANGGIFGLGSVEEATLPFLLAAA